MVTVYKERYAACKAKTLALYGKVSDALGKVDDGIVRTARKIEEGILKIGVVGEAKSGKSTFINAYLGASAGEEILPTGVLQCTSALIEVRHGDEPTLIVERADGREETVQGKADIHDFLKANAALSDAYRAIPTALIDLRLRENKGTLPEDLSEFSGYNTDALPKEEYEARIRRYSAERGLTWGDIVTKLKLRWPLGDALRDVQVVDSPGVGVGGDLSRVTEGFIDQADALLFVKSIKSGQVIEGASFLTFLNTNVGERKQDAVLVLCTGLATLAGVDKEDQMRRAREVYGNRVGKERVLFVDSLTQLCLNKCQALGTQERIDAFLDTLDAGDPMVGIWSRSKRDVPTFLRAMAERSNFDTVREVFDRFARRTGYRRLADFLGNLDEACTKRLALLGERKGVFEDMASATEHSLEACKAELQEKEKEIDALRGKLRVTIDTVFAKYETYSDTNPILSEKETLRAQYKKRLAPFETYTKQAGDVLEDKLAELKSLTKDFIAKANAFVDDMRVTAMRECQEALEVCLPDDGRYAPVIRPNFTEADFERMRDEAESEAKKAIDEANTFARWREHRLFADRVLRKLATTIRGDLDKRVDVMTDNAIKVLGALKSAYVKKVQDNLNEEAQELGRLRSDIRSYGANKSVYIREIDSLEGEIATVSGLVAEIEVLRGKVGSHADT